MCVSVCSSHAAFPHYCRDKDVSWGESQGCPLVVHCWADLQSAHGFRCCDNMAPNAKCQRVPGSTVIRCDCVAACACYTPGTTSIPGGRDLCDPRTGQCHCRHNVVGRRCDRCMDGYWNIDSSAGQSVHALYNT